MHEMSIDQDVIRIDLNLRCELFEDIGFEFI